MKPADEIYGRSHVRPTRMFFFSLIIVIPSSRSMKIVKRHIFGVL